MASGEAEAKTWLTVVGMRCCPWGGDVVGLEGSLPEARRVWYSSDIATGDYVAGQGTAGNVIAALCSFFIPGLGQLLQGRLLKAIIMFVLAGVLWFFLLGWTIHLWSVLDAALWRPKAA
jgi:TM2 domain-containing membrane protein YozV